jgi:hypothetical protein
MADAVNKPERRDPFEQIVEVLFIIFIVSAIFGAVVDYLSENRLLKIIIAGGPFAKTLPLDTRGVVIGRDVALRDTTSLYDTAGGRVIGQLSAGERGILVGGPERVNRFKYWFVSFENGAKGFVAEEDLFRRGNNFSESRSGVGEEVMVNNDATVYLDRPLGRVNFTAKTGSRGWLAGVPRVADKERFWPVDFSSGERGFVAEKYLTAVSGRSLNYFSIPIGDQVTIRGETEVYKTPAGEVIGLQRTGTLGVVIGPSRFAGSKRFWPTDFEAGPDGYVEEKFLRSPNDTLFPLVLRLIKIISTLLTLFFLTTIIYSVLRTTALRAAEAHKYSVDPPKELPKEDQVDPRWRRIMRHLDSENPSDWRLAILEADIVLGEMLEIMGYRGETVGEKLRAVEESDFFTISQAWEAHKVRNQIAHEGSDFLITQREARRIISLYRQVFEEFHMKTKS